MKKKYKPQKLKKKTSIIKKPVSAWCQTAVKRLFTAITTLCNQNSVFVKFPVCNLTWLFEAVQLEMPTAVAGVAEPETTISVNTRLLLLASVPYTSIRTYINTKITICNSFTIFVYNFVHDQNISTWIDILKKSRTASMFSTSSNATRTKSLAWNRDLSI